MQRMSTISRTEVRDRLMENGTDHGKRHYNNDDIGDEIRDCKGKK